MESLEARLRYGRRLGFFTKSLLNDRSKNDWHASRIDLEFETVLKQPLSLTFKALAPCKADNVVARKKHVQITAPTMLESPNWSRSLTSVIRPI